jgi:hypothetical protein
MNNRKYKQAEQSESFVWDISGSPFGRVRVLLAFNLWKAKSPGYYVPEPFFTIF